MNGTERSSDFAALKSRHREERDSYPQSLSLRVHRSLSWLDRAEHSADDKDVQFILLWIAFNAAYAQEVGADSSQSERERLHAFLGQLGRVDAKRFEDLVWKEFSGSVRVLLENKYVFQPFWDWRNGRISEAEYQRQFDGSRRTSNGRSARATRTSSFRSCFTGFTRFVTSSCMAERPGTVR